MEPEDKKTEGQESSEVMSGDGETTLTKDELTKEYEWNDPANQPKEEEPPQKTIPSDDEAQTPSGDAGDADEAKPEGEEEPESAIDPGLLERAATAGLTEDDVKSLGAERAEQVLGRNAQTKLAGLDRQPPAKPDDKGEQAKAPVLEKFELDANEDEMDPVMRDQLQKVIDHNHAQMEQLAGRQDASVKAHQEERTREYLGRFDGYCKGAAKDYGKELGKGEFASLTPGGTQQSNRAAIDATMAATKHVRASRKLAPLSERELFDRAVRTEFPDKTMEIARKKLVAEVEAGAETAVAEPTPRKAQVLSGTERAEERVAKFDRDHGYAPEVTVPADTF